MAVRTVQNVMTKPKDKTPIVNKQVTIKLNTRAFGDTGQREILSVSYAWSDSTGLWSASLDVNADLDPPGTYYTVQEANGVIWTFVIPAGTTPVWLRQCLVTPPAQQSPGSIVLPVGGVPGQVLGLLPDGTLGWLTPTSGSGDLIYGAGVYGAGVYSPAA